MSQRRRRWLVRPLPWRRTRSPRRCVSAWRAAGRWGLAAAVAACVAATGSTLQRGFPWDAEDSPIAQVLGLGLLYALPATVLAALCAPVMAAAAWMMPRRWRAAPLLWVSLGACLGWIAGGLSRDAALAGVGSSGAAVAALAALRGSLRSSGYWLTLVLGTGVAWALAL